ncbi:D-arabinono-1,4-lactone oxidase [Phytohabitans suffuscus]|uniref:Putative xylitol oxidase n=1 Tax=Phytohabitans suffuscus TaxID=624315 RepID=A0A6F8YNK3_9ACTN|nr:D-arabinono-1,4-lactone oxidase [Phytohabitans suffuscus]BCB87745.1 putative xylitol oxidase [Phytohabitans suffuscus]
MRDRDANERISNWAGNVTFAARRLHRPSSVPRLQALVAGAERIHALGTGHSFNRIADSPGDLVSVAGLPPVMDLDTAAATVTISAGLRYGEVAPYLDGKGYALHNLGSLPHLSVAGACATGTHGSGIRNGGLATAVAGIELVTAGGELVNLARGDGDVFDAVAVGLGAFGVATRLTLDVQPAFEVEQYVYDAMPLAALREHFTEVMAAAYSVSAFTGWTGPTVRNVWVKRRADEPLPPPRRWFGAVRADGPRHPVPGMPPENCTEQLGVPGPWHARLPHFRLEFTPSSGEELQTEYFVARGDAVAALDALDAVRDRIAPVLQICEIRTIAADRLWLSPSYGRDSVAFHFTWVRDMAAVAPVVDVIEERLARFDARPHWGKVFAMAPEVVAERYPRLRDAAALARASDPRGVFRNELLDRYLP